MMKRTMVVARTAVALLLVSASIALAADGLPGLDPGGDRGLGAAASAQLPSVKISGHVAGMYPGRVAKVRIRVRNPGRLALIVTKVSATVGDAGPGCDSSYLIVKRAKRKLRLAPGGRAKLKLKATMLPSAPDACQGLSFPLAFHAKVRPA